jgi:hypothetical protein
MWLRGEERGGGLIQSGAADIFTLISILQLKKVNSKNKYILQIRGPNFVKSTY